MGKSGSVGVIKYLENFQVEHIGAAAGAGLKWVTLADGGDTVFARAGAAGKGIHAAGALAATDNNLLELCGDLLDVFGQDGYNAIEVLFMVSSIADLAFNIGFNDDVLETSNTLPAELATTAWTTNATTFIGLVYDVDADNDDMHCMWVDDDNDSDEALANLRMQGIAPQAGKWCTARVEIKDRGAGKGVRGTFTFSCEGKTATKEFNTSVDRDAGLCPYMGFENRAATAHNIYIKYIALEQSIAD